MEIVLYGIIMHTCPLKTFYSIIMQYSFSYNPAINNKNIVDAQTTFLEINTGSLILCHIKYLNISNCTTE
jgi:hypothetical protein